MMRETLCSYTHLDPCGLSPAEHFKKISISHLLCDRTVTVVIMLSLDIKRGATYSRLPGEGTARAKIVINSVIETLAKITRS